MISHVVHHPLHELVLGGFPCSQIWIVPHQKYQVQGDRAKGMKKHFKEIMERGWIQPSDSEWASPAFIVPKKEKGEWRLVVHYCCIEY